MRIGSGIINILCISLVACASYSTPLPVTPGSHSPNDDGGDSGIEWTPLDPVSEFSNTWHPDEQADDYEWYPDILEPHNTVVEQISLTSVNGNQIDVDVHRPAWASEEMQCHGLVLVPGGIQVGDVWHAPWRKSGSYHWSAAGFIVIDFDFQGRGNSEGEEDWYGLIHREDLKTVIEYCTDRPDVLPIGAGLVSSSFGVTVCSCTLGTYTDLQVRFFIDLEGAQNRHVATQFDNPFWVNIWGGHDTSDDEFWDDREAITLQGDIISPYIRVQSDMDHAFDYFYVDHAIQMCNAALFGPSPYTRLNHNPPNELLHELYQLTYQYEDVDLLDERLYMYVIEASIAEF